MSVQPRPFRPGQAVTAARLNGVRNEAVRNRRASVAGPGSSFVGECRFPSQSSHMMKPQVQLVQAVEDFAPGHTTDTYSPDDVPAGKCLLMRVGPDSSGYLYQLESGMEPFKVWDVMSSINGTPAKQKGESFYAIWNSDSCRMEAVSAGGQGPVLRHGLVSECLGMGWYRVELMDCIQYEPPDCEKYDPFVEQSGGSGSGAGPETCDDCDFSTTDQCKGDASGTNFNQFCGSGDVVFPLRPRKDSSCFPLVGNGEFVYALDKRTVPLKIDGMVTVAWLGDYCTGTSGWETGCSECESGCAEEQESTKLYVVLNGEYQMVAIPIKEYECCDDGTVQMVQCTTFVVEGSVCKTPRTPCPTDEESGSGSGGGTGGGTGGTGGGGPVLGGSGGDI